MKSFLGFFYNNLEKLNHGIPKTVTKIIWYSSSKHYILKGYFGNMRSYLSESCWIRLRVFDATVWCIAFLVQDARNHRAVQGRFACKTTFQSSFFPPFWFFFKNPENLFLLTASFESLWWQILLCFGTDSIMTYECQDQKEINAQSALCRFGVRIILTKHRRQGEWKNPLKKRTWQYIWGRLQREPRDIVKEK